MKSIGKKKLWIILMTGVFFFAGGFIPMADNGQQTEEWLVQAGKQLLTSAWGLGQQLERPKTALWKACLGYVPTNPYASLAEEMPYLLAAERTRVEIVVEQENYETAALVNSQWNFSSQKLTEATLSEEVQVILYHTHNAETYQPSDGVSKLAGQNGGIAQAGEILKQCLERSYGIKTLHNLTLHDYPDWSRSYKNSLNTINNLLQGNPQVQAVFDVHRDAGYTKKEPTTIMINGKNAAKIMIVIGANHDHWQQNLAFARQLEDSADRLYPGLVKDLRIVQTSRYNQQAHPHSLILEIGSDLNTQEEADYAMECFAQVIAEVL